MEIGKTTDEYVEDDFEEGAHEKLDEENSSDLSTLSNFQKLRPSLTPSSLVPLLSSREVPCSKNISISVNAKPS